MRNPGHSPFISVVLPTYNRLDKLKQCLAALFLMDYPQDKYEIIVVNDGSTDATEVFLKETAEVKTNFRFITTANKGNSFGRNIGFKMANGEIIASLDDDCITDNNWLNNIARTFTSFPDAAAVGGSIINLDDSLEGWAQHLLCFDKWLPLGKTRSVKDIPTCNIAYRKDHIQNCVFLEEGKNIYYRDAIFNYNLITAGKMIYFNPDIKVYHMRTGSSTAQSSFEYQKRYAMGFLMDGYKVHGLPGRILFKYRILNIFCPRLILVFIRCMRSPKYFITFLRCLLLILKGEWTRNKAIMKADIR